MSNAISPMILGQRNDEGSGLDLAILRRASAASNPPMLHQGRSEAERVRSKEEREK